MEIKAKLSIGYPSAVRADTLEVDDEMTEEEIEEFVQEWANGYIETSWKKKGRESA